MNWSSFALAESFPARPQPQPKTVPNLLITKYLTNKSLFLKDLEEMLPKSLISKDRFQGGPAASVSMPHPRKESTFPEAL